MINFLVHEKTFLCIVSNVHVRPLQKMILFGNGIVEIWIFFLWIPKGAYDILAPKATFEDV